MTGNDSLADAVRGALAHLDTGIMGPPGD